MSTRLAFVIPKNERCANNSGLTLLECLVAISVIGLASALIAPVMLFSVATRVQSQKAEQALQLAQLEIDSIRVEVERGDYKTFIEGYPKTPESPGEISKTVAPTSSDSILSPTDATVAKKVYVDEDKKDAFAVQVFRTGDDNAVSASDGTPMVFRVGVRVYDDDAVRENSGSLLTEKASLSFTSGEGQRGLRPLAVLYSDITSSDQDLSLCNYRTYLKPTVKTINDNLDCS